MMQSVIKQYIGDIVEGAREIQEEWVQLGEKQTDLPNDELQPTNAQATTILPRGMI